ncbi:MAG: CheR family methyltransferase [Nocardioides sp.]|nr:CheR family methyltransferase [Nocardioides sp.]
MEDLLRFIRDARGFDFTGYKRASLARRIRKRKQDVGVEEWNDYRDRLEIDSDEFRALFNTILTNVTGFLRDVDAWNVLQGTVLPEVLARSEPTEEIRIWSAGCSSGEEAYSLAIAVAEAIGLDKALERVKIYGTDVDDEALREARAGSYPAKKLEGLLVCRNALMYFNVETQAQIVDRFHFALKEEGFVF